MRRLLISLLILICWSAPALAGGGLSVSPISVEFSGDEGPRALEVSNPGDKIIQVQVRLFDWRVDREGDHYAPSQDFAFSPPMFSLRPGAVQTVRLAPRARSGGGERAYRLFVDQLPEAAAPGQLNMPVRMVLPVFVGGDGGKGSALHWRVEYDPRADEAVLIAANPGVRRVKVTELAYREGARETRLRPGLAGYVLAGEELGWRFATPRRLGTLEVTAKTDSGPITVRVPFRAD